MRVGMNTMRGALCRLMHRTPVVIVRFATALLAVTAGATAMVAANSAAADAQVVQNTISVPVSVVSVGDVVHVSGHNAAGCTSGTSLLDFQPVHPPSGEPSLLLFPTPGTSGSWTYDFAVPASLPVTRSASIAVTPGTYTLTNSCIGATAATAQITVSAAYQPQRFVALTGTPDGDGYWLAQADGGVFAFGDAGFYGSLPALKITPTVPIVGMAATPDGRGYWLVGSDGGVFAFGDAPFLGSAPGVGFSAAPFRSIAASASLPMGYVLSPEYEDTLLTFFPSSPPFTTSPPPNAAPFVGISLAVSGGPSTWVASADGGVYTYTASGQFPAFYGSLPSRHIAPAAPIVAMAATPDHRGYWLMGSDGGVFAFGDAQFYGSAA